MKKESIRFANTNQIFINLNSNPKERWDFLFYLYYRYFNITKICNNIVSKIYIFCLNFINNRHYRIQMSIFPKYVSICLIFFPARIFHLQNAKKKFANILQKMTRQRHCHGTYITWYLMLRTHEGK